MAQTAPGCLAASPNQQLQPRPQIDLPSFSWETRALLDSQPKLILRWQSDHLHIVGCPEKMIESWNKKSPSNHPEAGANHCSTSSPAPAFCVGVGSLPGVSSRGSVCLPMLGQIRCFLGFIVQSDGPGKSSKNYSDARLQTPTTPAQLIWCAVWAPGFLRALKMFLLAARLQNYYPNVRNTCCPWLHAHPHYSVTPTRLQRTRSLSNIKLIF